MIPLSVKAVGVPTHSLLQPGHKKSMQALLQVGVKPGEAVSCCFSHTADLLFVLVPREVRHCCLHAGFVGCTQLHRHHAVSATAWHHARHAGIQ